MRRPNAPRTAPGGTAGRPGEIDPAGELRQPFHVLVACNTSRFTQAKYDSGFSRPGLFALTVHLGR